MSKKRDSKPLYVPPRPSPARTKGSKPQATGDDMVQNGEDIVDGIADLSIKPVKAKKVVRTKTSHDKEKPTRDGVVDSWEDILDGIEDKDKCFKPVSNNSSKLLGPYINNRNDMIVQMMK